MRSNFLQIVDGRFVGADAVVAKEKETGKFDYDAPIEGLQALDRYTLRFKLNFPDYELLANLTTTPTAAVAREVVDAYGDASGWVMANPVGTGPYKLKDWRRGQRIILVPNPGFRDERYPEPTDPADSALVRKARRSQAAADRSGSRFRSSRKRTRGFSRFRRSSSIFSRCRTRSSRTS